MIHLVRQIEADPSPVYAEAVARLASVRHALRLVDGGFSAGPEDDLHTEVAAAWPETDEAKRRWFDRRSSRLVGSAAVGIEALLSERQMGREPNREASKTLVEEIRRELRSVAGIVLA
ncbi:MAG TPA: hypothetical protein VGU01_01765 [Sphingomicrobium sp.]|nr:hypothetical protein [Sphingomicrobium sp.]